MELNPESKTPLALFTYNRPYHTRRALESLTRCNRIEECKIFIYCDGPKHSDDMNNIIASQQVVQNFAEKLGANIIIQEKNIGLAHSIVSGVSDLCERFGRVIVIEDDLVVSPSFIDYMLQALDRYQDEEHVYQISGFLFPIDASKHQDTFFLPFITTWGWATWNRAWKSFDWNATGYEKLFSDKKMSKQFNLDNSYPYCDMLLDRFSGKNESWGILWWYAVFSVGGLVLYPGRTLVNNCGFDGTGTHCGNSIEYIENTGLSRIDIYSDDQVIRFPEKMITNMQKYGLVKKYLTRNRRNLFQTILRPLRILIQFCE